MSELRGKVALITGGNGGIGLGMAEGLARAGCDLVIWGSNPDKNAAAEKILRTHKGRVLAQRCDVADETQVEDAFAAALKTMGRIDGCFANAGVSQKHGSFHELESAEWKRVLAVNLDGAFYTLRAAARHMVARAKAGDPGGRLVGMASTAAVHGAARAGLRREQGRHARPGARAGGRACALQGDREFDPAGLDRDRHDRARDGRR